jgi:O-antigen/teichoic acid export membrane protein
MVQGISFVGSFALLRWMSVEDYAIFTLAWSIQSMMMAFGDLGVGGAVVPMVGSAVDDPRRLGACIAAGRQLRRWLFPIVCLGGALTFWLLGREHGISLLNGSLLFLCALLSLWLNASTLFYSAPLIIRQKLGYIYILQNGVVSLRVLSYSLAQLFGCITAALPLLTNVILQAGQLLVIRKKSNTHIDEPPMQSPEAVKVRRELVRFLAPQIPVLIFNTFIGQVTIFIVSLVGTTAALAEIGAISRLSALFAPLAGLFGLIIVPYFTRLDQSLVGRRTFQLFCLGCGLLTALVAFGFFLPQPFILILGEKYAHLRPEIGWTLLAFGMGQIAGLMASIIYARKIIPRLSIVFIALPVVLAQLIGAYFYPPSTIHGAILITLWTNLGSLFGHWMLFQRFNQPKESYP